MYIQKLPPKMLAQFAEKARRNEGCKPIGSFRLFAQGNNVISILLGEGWEEGHMRRNPYEAEEIRKYLASAHSEHGDGK